ncbi:microfibril-associated glycoprotein 4-like isoform X1 [Mytilus galloprovincialis]|uniref:microfibril-associated glycoprotein 4-like isoform X1 n=1 Tax=Mytilus galloprovincialis TaxID=29158 RepID=UPI003F7C4AD3
MTKLIVAVFMLSVAIINCGQDCLSCTGIETAGDCDRRETCNNDEVCFKQKYSTTSGKVLFDFGCSKSQLCSKSLGTIFGRREEGHHIICEACCNNTRYCNGELRCDPVIKQNYTHLPRECSEIIPSNLTSGIYNIYPFNSHIAVPVFCDMTTENKSWTVIQRRYNGSVDFFRDWMTYKEGFGSVDGEYWLGNDIIHRITSSGNHELRIDLSDFEGNDRYAKYSSFLVGDEWSQYQLHVSNYSGDSGNFLMHPKYNHNGMPFSTYDHDADDSPLNCAAQYKGGWWYNHCLIANLNGRYLSGHHNSFADGIDVIIWHGTHYSLKTVTMMITKINL